MAGQLQARAGGTHGGKLARSVLHRPFVTTPKAEITETEIGVGRTIVPRGCESQLCMATMTDTASPRSQRLASALKTPPKSSAYAGYGARDGGPLEAAHAEDHGLDFRRRGFPWTPVDETDRRGRDRLGAARNVILFAGQGRLHQSNIRGGNSR